MMTVFFYFAEFAHKFKPDGSDLGNPYLKLLDHDGDNLIVGARNALYSLNANDLRENESEVGDTL